MPCTSATRRFPARLDALPDALAFVAEICGRAGVDTAVRLRAELAVEELFTNTVRHGVHFGNEPEIRLDMVADARNLHLTYQDSAQPFNPLADIPPPAPLELESRPVGGLGRALIGQLPDTASYRREGGRNVLELVLSSA